MELHGALRDVQLCRNFFIRKMLKNPVEHFLLAAADLHPCPKGSPRSQKFLGPLGGRIQQGCLWNDHQLVILGRLAPHETMHRQQPRNLFHRHTAVGPGLDVETHCARTALAQNKALRKEGRLPVL